MNKQFEQFLNDFVTQYKTAVFNDVKACKSLLLDHAKGEFSKEIRLFLQALELGCHTAILNSNDLNLTRMVLIKRFQDEYFISGEIATLLIDLLLLELRNYKNKNVKLEENIPKKSTATVLSQLSTNNNNSISAISTLLFIDKIKSVYEPIFIEYENIMKENGLYCSHSTGLIAGERILHMFFTNKSVSNAHYIISNTSKSLIKISAFPHMVSKSPFERDSGSVCVYSREIKTENLIEKVLINDLNLFIKEILKLMGRT
jgi:hypothetical protein